MVYFISTSYNLRLHILGHMITLQRVTVHSVGSNLLGAGSELPILIGPPTS